MANKEYYLGLDIGTDSVGYAAADTDYKLLKFKGEPMWGVTLFDPAMDKADRRGFRTARRRLHRKRARVEFMMELFAPAIGKIDPAFFRRIRESALFPEDREDPNAPIGIFTDEGFTDKEYAEKYPTIHHLINSLMTDSAPHDVRLVYLACAWLVGHRGHFLREISMDNVEAATDFSEVYNEFLSHFKDNGIPLPWHCEDVNAIRDWVLSKKGKTEKKKQGIALLYGGKLPKTDGEEYPYDRGSIVALISGSKLKAGKLFPNSPEYAELGDLTLDMEDEKLEELYAALGDDAEIIRKLKSIYDWSVLTDLLDGCECISEAKVKVYDRHAADLRALKPFFRKYLGKNAFDDFFRSENNPTNYVAYKSGSKNAKKEIFSENLKKLMDKVNPEDCDREFYNGMLDRLERNAFLPKQVDGDNRVIPYQLYKYELMRIVENAKSYLPFLSEKDADGYVTADKIVSIIDFRVPYYVGPLCKSSKHAWLTRKADRITPWNFTDVVDLDASEEGFIKKLTNSCTYLAGESVLPKSSLLYSAFTVLNAINNVKINGEDITVETKQRIYTEVFGNFDKVTKKRIADFLIKEGKMDRTDTVSGIDDTVNATLKPFKYFKRLLESGTLTESDAESIIKRLTYSEDRSRRRHWIEKEYPTLSPEDVKYLAALPFKDFGRLSRNLLCELQGVNQATGEVMTVIEALWSTNDNLMQLLSDKYDFAEKIAEHQREYYGGKEQSLDERLDEMYVSNAVKRPIIRALDIIDSVVKAQGCPPKKIFIEMARGANEDQKGKRTVSRLAQLREYYKQISTEDAREVSRQLEELGAEAENKLQSERLYLYFRQLGRCMYSGETIDISKLSDKTYDVDHIYPQCFVKDDSVHNNKVLVLSTINSAKSDQYPLTPEIQNKMRPYWDMLKKNGLITEEKHKRLTRTTPFSAEERWAFINRQLVETQQSTKAVKTLMEEKYAQKGTEVVCVKAGLVSDFRHVYDLLKSRDVNDLHHAKDAYLNIVVGNVYNEKFTHRWFDPYTDRYSIKVESLFKYPVEVNKNTVWRGDAGLNDVKRVMAKNTAHLTRYQFCRHGGYFDQMPLKAQAGLIERKNGLDTTKYGGYAKTTASFFALIKYNIGKKCDVMITPVELLYADKFISDEAFATEYAVKTVADILGKTPSSVSFPLGKRILKVNTLFEFDGFRMCLGSKVSGGTRNGWIPLMTLAVTPEINNYIKALRSFADKCAKNPNLVYNEKYDRISHEKNMELYSIFISKGNAFPYDRIPNSIIPQLIEKKERFATLSVKAQANCLLQIAYSFKSGRVGGCDISEIGSAPSAGVIVLNSRLSNWKNFKDIRIIDTDAAGLHEKRSHNLLELLK